MAGLGVPDHGQVIDVENERGRTLGGLRDAVLRIFEARELFHVAKANFQRPAQRKLVRISGGVSSRSVEKKQSSRRRCAGSCTTMMRSNFWPALEYHKASTVLY